MTTNSPNPADGDVQALIERICVALKQFTSGRASMHVPPLDTDVDIVLADCEKMLKSITTPPAQLLRPAELPKSDGWIEWSGGDCPVFDYSLVETEWSSGAIVEDCAGEFDWSFEDGSCNIIAYRVVKS